MASPQLDRRKLVLGAVGVAAGGVTLAAAPSPAPAPSPVPAPVPAPAPAPAVPWKFEISANVGGVSDTDIQPTFTDMLTPQRGFGTIADPYRNTMARPALNPKDRFPAEDFALVLPRQSFSTSAQVIKCKVLGLATITIGNAVGWTLANVIVRGDNTTFDINIPASAAQSQAILSFANSKRTAASATNTGCRGLIIKQPGFAVTDTTTAVLPYMLTAWAPFSRLRFMSVPLINNNTFTITPADRQKDGIRQKLAGLGTLRTISLEDAVRTCNQANKNLWWCIYSAANDALITEMATVVRDMLNPGLNVMFELGNECWNYQFDQFVYFMDMVMDRVNGFSYTYCTYARPSTWHLTSNVITMTYNVPHNINVGEEIYGGVLNDPVTGGGVASAAGIKTVLSVPTPESLTFAATHGNVAETKVVAGFVCRGGRAISYGSRLANVATIHFGTNHGMTTGQTIGTSGISGAAKFLVITVTTPREITFACTGADGPLPMGGGVSIVGSFTDPLNSYDQSRDQFQLQSRMYAERTTQMSTILQGVFGPGAFGSRLRVGLYCAPGADQGIQLSYIASAFGPPKNYLTHIGQATYFFFDATKWGGPNLRNVTTYNGNSPPALADYTATMAITCANAKTSLADRYDRTAMNCGIYDLKAAQYEYGPNVTANTPNAPGPVVGKQKLDSLFDPSFKATYRVLLDELEAGGFEEACCYHAGVCPPGATDEFSSWGIYRDFSRTPSVRVDATLEKIAATRTGPTRNLLAPTGTTIIDPHQILGIYVNTGPYPNLGVGDPARQDWVITAPFAGDWSFTPTFNGTHVTATVLEVNGVQIGAEYPIPIGVTTPAPRTISLRQGVNSLRMRQGSLYVGAYAQATNFAFTSV